MVENKYQYTLDARASRHFYSNRDLFHAFLDSANGECVLMRNSTTNGVLGKGKSVTPQVLEGQYFGCLTRGLGTFHVKVSLIFGSPSLGILIEFRILKNNLGFKLENEALIILFFLSGIIAQLRKNTKRKFFLLFPSSYSSPFFLR